MLTFFYGTWADVLSPMAPKYSYLDIWLTITLFNLFASGTLNLDFGIRFTEEPADSLAVRRQPFVLNCSAENAKGEPVNITWWRSGDNQQINDARRYVLRNGSLMFERVIHRKRKKEGDEGSYICKAESADKSLVIISRMAKLSIAKLDPFSKQPRSENAVEGESVRFQCSISGLPLPNISWQKNKQPLPLHQGRYTVLASGVLHIHNVVQSDNGQYRCLAENIAKSRSSAEATLSVTARPAEQIIEERILAGPAAATLIMGKSVIMECLTQGQENPQISWKFKPLNPQPGTPNILSITEDGVHSFLGGSNLLINQLMAQDEGQYTCLMKTTDGDVAASNPANLTVHVPPYSLLPEKSQGVLVTSSAVNPRFQCQFDGSPQPAIYWTFNGAFIRMAANGGLQLRHGDQLDHPMTGIYQCFGHNVVGEAHRSFRVLVQLNSIPVPDPPENLRAIEITSNSITLEWDISALPDNFIAYTIHYQKVDEGSELQIVSNKNIYKLDSLDPYTNYSMFIVTYSNRNASGRSKFVYVTTDEDVPYSAPKVSVEPFGSRKLKIQWQPLDARKARGRITDYNIYYRVHGSDEIFSSTVKAEHVNKDESSNEFVLKSLVPNVKYDIRVKAGTKMGFPDSKQLTDEHWPWVSATTLEQRDGPPDPPDVQVSALNESTVQVAWDVSDGISGYTITYQKVNDDDAIHAINVIDDLSNYVIGGLTAGTQYRVGVAAHNEYGPGEAAESTVRTLERGMMPEPPPPTQVTCTRPVNNTTITITWSRSSFPVGNMNYTVRYRPLRVIEFVGKQEVILFRERDTPEQSIQISELEPFTKYEIAVRSKTDTTTGEFSNAVTCRTEEGRPSAPRDPKAELIDETNIVKLKWSPPEKANGVIIRYVINYSLSSDKEPEKWLTKQENGSVTEAIVKELEKNAIYYFKLRAATQAGDGPPTKSIKVETKALVMPPPPPVTEGQEGQEMGIIIGACIGGSCIIICTLIFLLRNRYCPPPPARQPVPRSEARNGNCSLPNGYSGARPHGYMPNGVLDSSTIPMMMENHHCDTKGSTDYPMRVLHMGQLQANYSDTGHVTTFLAAEPPDSDNHMQDPNRVTARSGLVSGQPAPVRTNHAPNHDQGSLDEIDHTLNSDDFPEYTDTTEPHQMAAGKRHRHSPEGTSQRADSVESDTRHDDVHSRHDDVNSTSSASARDSPCAEQHPGTSAHNTDNTTSSAGGATSSPTGGARRSPSPTHLTQRLSEDTRPV